VVVDGHSTDFDADAEHISLERLVLDISKDIGVPIDKAEAQQFLFELDRPTVDRQGGELLSHKPRNLLDNLGDVRFIVLRSLHRSLDNFLILDRFRRLIEAERGIATAARRVHWCDY